MICWACLRRNGCKAAADCEVAASGLAEKPIMREVTILSTAPINGSAQCRCLFDSGSPGRFTLVQPCALLSLDLTLCKDPDPSAREHLGSIVHTLQAGPKLV
ncbi:hypothetical protein PUR_40040 [Paenibacillus sp. URB8-2]|nr:hypothetical protein PUR_40040 [Paenibacillus sp. URB8-2]